MTSPLNEITFSSLSLRALSDLYLTTFGEAPAQRNRSTMIQALKEHARSANGIAMPTVECHDEPAIADGGEDDPRRAGAHAVEGIEPCRDSSPDEAEEVQNEGSSQSGVDEAGLAQPVAVADDGGAGESEALASLPPPALETLSPAEPEATSPREERSVALPIAADQTIGATGPLSPADPRMGSAVSAPPSRWEGMSIADLQQLYVATVGRSTMSENAAYLKWKIREAEEGRVRTGPRATTTTPAPAVPYTVYSLRLPTAAAEALEGAWFRYPVRSRTEFVRKAIAHYLTSLGATEEAALFAEP